MTISGKSTDIGSTVFRDGDYIGLKDGNGNISLSPELCFSDIKIGSDIHNIWIATRNDRQCLINSHGDIISKTDYNKIEPADEGFFLARRGRKYNLLRPNGSEVLRFMAHHIGEIHHGFFIIGITERKTSSSATRHLYGLAHVDGSIVFSPIFEKLTWREHSFFYAEKDNHPYIIKEDGSIIDLTFQHLPERLEVDQKVFVEKALDWILTGMRVYYRDSDAPINPADVYQVGKIIRAGFFVDVSTRLQKPLTKLRFLICSAHVAPWEDINELVVDNPDIARWGFCTLHCNSYYIVLDIYTKGGVTQVSLLHIPPAVAKNIGDSAPAILKIIKQIPTEKGTLVDITRKLLDRNMRLKRHTQLNDEYLMQCMRHPIGLNNVFDPVILEPAKLKGDAAALGKMVTKLAKDGDIDNYYTGNLADNFMWHGLTDSICDGCIYTKGITDKFNGCGRLTSGSFRRNYMRGHCEYRKPDIAVYSQAEIDAKHRWSKYQEHVEKSSRVYAKNIVRKFVNEHLGGDIDKLATFNFTKLTHGTTYIDTMPTLMRTPIVRALMALIFDDVWLDLTYDAIERFDFECGRLHSTAQQLGEPDSNNHFPSLDDLHPTPQQETEAFELYNLTSTLGNFCITPNRGERTTLNFTHNNTYYNGYAAQFISDLHMALTKPKQAPTEILQLVHANSKYFDKYKGIAGFKKLMHALMLDEFTDESNMPRILFDNTTWRNPGNTFFDDLSACHKFYSEIMPRRAARMIEKLKKLL